jgi:thiol-disulfide isomerase/thioredoxin
MIRKLLITTGALAVALSGTVAVLYISNAAPIVPAVSASEAAASMKPFVVKLHAQWCPYCMLTKDEWARVERAYAGRVNFVVLDFTNEAASERSRVQAERLGLRQFFDDYGGATGLVVVLDGRTREVLAEVGGNAPFDDFQAAIDAALMR